MSRNETLIGVMDVGVTYKQKHSLFRRFNHAALDGIRFDVLKGESLGIIGPNGCGKSTLLKVLAGIYRPDSGRILRNCRSVALLSLALGFDPNLSGRANAVILGMFLGARRSEVMARLGEIVEFSGIGDFIDEPLHTYSTGMRARLGFSVAITMQADLLLIDEVLGVGDLSFNSRAGAALAQKITSEQTVVLVSHSLHQIERLCDRVVWLDKGRMMRVGKPMDVIQEYRQSVASQSA